MLSSTPRRRRVADIGDETAGTDTPEQEAFRLQLLIGGEHGIARDIELARKSPTGRQACTGGDARRIANSGSVELPRILPVRASSTFRGDNWLGLKMREASVVKGIGVLPIFAGVIGLLLLLGAFAATWLREGR